MIYRRRYDSPRSEMLALRREIVGDSLDREKVMKRLLTLVREQERANTLGRLADARTRAEGSAR